MLAVGADQGRTSAGWLMQMGPFDSVNVKGQILLLASCDGLNVCSPLKYIY